MTEIKNPETTVGVVSNSPTAADFNIYERAFDRELERIKQSTSRKRTGGHDITRQRLSETEPQASGWYGETASGRGFAELVAKAMKDAKKEPH